MILTPLRGSGGNGRRARFRFLCPHGRGGSTPPSRIRQETPATSRGSFISPFHIPYLGEAVFWPSLTAGNSPWLRMGDSGHSRAKLVAYRDGLRRFYGQGFNDKALPTNPHIEDATKAALAAALDGATPEHEERRLSQDETRLQDPRIHAPRRRPQGGVLLPPPRDASGRGNGRPGLTRGPGAGGKVAAVRQRRAGETRRRDRVVAPARRRFRACSRAAAPPT
jgi:hypothetical protein